MRFHLAFAALAATTVFAAPAAAQSKDTIKAEALLIQPATLQRVDDLSFGTIVATPASSGTVTVAVDGTRTTVSATGELTEAGVAKRGRFIGNGIPFRDVGITVDFPDVLLNTEDDSKSVSFEGVLDAASSDGTIKIGATGIFYVDVGGTITIATDQAPGLYSGDVTVTANFQ
jgi:hypothetical protein